MILIRNMKYRCKFNLSSSPLKTNVSPGGLLVPEGIIRSVVSGSALTWFIRYLFLSKFTLPKIIIKTGSPLLCICDLSRF